MPKGQNASPGLLQSSSSSESRGLLYPGNTICAFPLHLRLLWRIRNTAEPSPVNTRKISSLPSSMPAISTSSVAAQVDGPVKPMDRPTVPSEEANSNMQLASGALSVMHSSSVPAEKFSDKSMN